MIDKILGFVAPHRCYGCTEIGAVLCHGCYDDIITDDFGCCVWCMTPAPDMNQCRECTKKLGITGAWVVGERSEVLKRLVGDHKYLSVREAGGIMAQLLSERVAVLPADTVVCAVPTINQHIRQRGFDHAEILARMFARQRNLTYVSLLERKTQLSQHQLKRAARQRAARDAFGLKSPINNKPVMLIDDIVTTGATLEACVRLLQDGGASQVYIGVIARQPLE
jgi:ComF family protein